MRKVRREVTRKLILAAVIGEPNAVSNAIGYAMVESRQSRTNRGPTQKIRRYARLIPLGLPTIELGGGSARCITATIHLAPRL